MHNMTTSNESLNLERRKVYDPLLRLIHWTMALSVTGLALTGLVAAELVEDNQALEKAMWSVHIWMGWVLSGSLAVRLLWALAGPQHARWRELWQWQAWRQRLAALRNRTASDAAPASASWGHDSVAALAYLGFFALVALMALSGLVLAAVEHNAGPLAPNWLDRFEVAEPLEEIHEIAAWLIVAFVGVHLTALIYHERREGRPLAQAMLSGYQYRRVQKVVLAVVGATALTLAWQTNLWAATPQDFLAQYSRAAGGAPFSATRGRAFYEQVVGGDPQRSCSACHTGDPRAAGTSAAGKRIEPMAGNPARFTDAAQVDKWFRRNCNDVLARACTPAEKGDFITYILSR